MTIVYRFKAGYTTSGVASTPSSAPTCTIVTSANAVIASAQATTALSNMAGVYLYSYTGAANLDLIALFHTSDTTVDQQDFFVIPDAAYLIQQQNFALGAGAITTVITVTDGINPIDGVDVWITTDSAGTNVVARGNTNTLGQVTFYLDAGTVYVWKQLAGYSFINPTSQVVV